jgi:hypothetical protein
MSTQPNLTDANAQNAIGRRRPLLFMLLIFVILFVVAYASRLSDYRRLLNQEASMQDQIENAEANGRELAYDLEYVKSQEYAERMAVLEFGMGRGKDRVLTVIDAPDVSLAAEQATAEHAVAEQLGLDQDGSPATPVERVAEFETAVQSDAESPVWRQWLSVFRVQNE